MNKKERNKLLQVIKITHTNYLTNISANSNYQIVKTRFRKLFKKIKLFLRKEYGSSNSLKSIPNIARLIFGLHEDLLRYGLLKYLFENEMKLLNHYIIKALDNRRSSKYFGKCASYGETLLNCYLDTFITFTVLKTPKMINPKPTFLVNPTTGSNLELDVLFEDFRLAFEFQGEHHYKNVKVSAKDKIKLQECKKYKRILIPINISQLQSDVLAILIVNLIKDYLGLHDILANRDPSKLGDVKTSKKELSRFCKVTQRIYLAKIVFKETLDWLDNQAKIYISNSVVNSPISSRTLAPRLKKQEIDLNVEYVYRNLSYIRKTKKNL